VAEGLEDRLPLDLLDRAARPLPQRDDHPAPGRPGGVGLRELEAKVLGENLVGGDEDGPADRLAQFSQVPRPGVVEENL